MKKLKKILCFICAMAIMTFMAACNSKDSGDKSSGASTVEPSSAATVASKDSGEKTKIKIWSNARSDYDYMLTVMDSFNKDNKSGIEVEFEVYTDNYYQALELAYDTGEAPDIFQNGQNAMTNLIPKNKVQPLNEYLTAELKAYFGDSAFVETVNMFDGKIYSLPSVGSTSRLFYNRNIFKKAGIEAPPKTLDELVSISKTITDKLKGEGIYGFAINLKSPSSALGRSLNTIVMEESGGMYNFDKGEYDFSGYKSAANSFKQIFDNKSEFPGCDQLDIDPLRTQFAAGKIGMYFSWSQAEPGVYTTQFPTEEDWDAAPLPATNGIKKGSQGNGAGTWWCISADSKNKDKAWEVVNYLYSEEVQIPYYEKGLGMSVISSVLEKATPPENVKKWPSLAMSETDKTWPGMPLGLTIEGDDWSAMFAGYILSDPKYSNIDDIISDLNKRYNEALKKGIADGTVKPVVFPGFNPANPAQSMKK